MAGGYAPSSLEEFDGCHHLDRHVPERTCVGCRGKAPRHRLVRVVVSTDNGLTVDSTATAPGRGAWIHPDENCLNQAIKKRAFARALRIDGPCDGETIRAQVVCLARHG